MPVTKDLVRSYEITTDRPAEHGGSAPTWTEYKGDSTVERLGGDSDNPSEEVTMQDLSDGRQVAASNDLNFSHTIFELTESDAVYDLMKTASMENEDVWIRRTSVQDGSQEILGGTLGFTVGVGKVRPGDEGHKAFTAMFRGKGLLDDLIIDAASGS